MGNVKLAAKLPDDKDLNGLDGWLKHFRDTPFEQVCAIAYLDVQKSVTDYEKGYIQPIVQIVAVEVIATATETPRLIQDAFTTAHDRRINVEPLPFDETAGDDPEHIQRAAITDGVDLEASMKQVEQIIDAEIVDSNDAQEQVQGKCWDCHGPVERREDDLGVYYYCSKCDSQWSAEDLWYGPEGDES